MFRPILIALLAVVALGVETREEGEKLPVAYGLQGGNIDLGFCASQGTCSVAGIEGACVSISSGCCSGTVTAGLCPGSSDIKCCTNNGCSTPSGAGVCKQTSACGGKSIAGYCSGPADLQCCVENTPAPAPVCDYQATCTANFLQGVCVSVGSGCCTGTVTSGLCPGSSDIKCCTENGCATPYGNGICISTSLCTGTSHPGYCAGPGDMQCCVGGTPPVPPTPSTTEYGIDVSTDMSASTASCLASSGNSFVIPRGYCSDGTIDHRVCNTLTTAANAGFKTRDTYLFPCPTCGTSADSQVRTLLDHLSNNCKSAWSGRIWLDIEGSQYWTGDYNANRNFYQGLVDSCNSNGVRCGVYSSASQWSAIFGSLSYSYGANFPLWYPHYDDSPSFGDFSPFGGWNSPHAKQYAGTTSVCGMGVDKNYSPAF